jgi:hypothetical protein
MYDRSLLRSWVRATWLGWLFGIPCIIALALLGETVGIGGAQALVGAGMGAGVGFMQRRIVRGLQVRATPWFWSCAIGLALPFLAFDLARAAGREITFSLYASVALGGLIAGAWQGYLLRAHLPKAGWWLPASLLGWSMASGVAAIADTLSRTQQLRGIAGALAYLSISATGGLVLGLVTGLSLVWLVRLHAKAVGPASQ